MTALLSYFWDSAKIKTSGTSEGAPLDGEIVLEGEMSFSTDDPKTSEKIRKKWENASLQIEIGSSGGKAGSLGQVRSSSVNIIYVKRKQFEVIKKEVLSVKEGYIGTFDIFATLSEGFESTYDAQSWTIGMKIEDKPAPSSEGNITEFFNKIPIAVWVGGAVIIWLLS